MTTSSQTVKLVEVAELNPDLAERLAEDASVSFVPMSAVSAETASIVVTEERQYSEVSKGYSSFVNGDLLVAKITPCFENGKIAQADLPHHFGFGSTEFHVVRPQTGKVEPRYLLHFLRQECIRREGELRMTGSAGQRRVPKQFLAQLDIPLPPLTEQRRIAEVLDRAEALRAKRRAALVQLESLIQSLFIGIFGDPATNPKGWPILRLQNVLCTPFRNGISPSNTGTRMDRVLTLSAITGEGFDESAVKTSTFLTDPPPHQRVSETDFLICRGNGNIRLVGKGYFPARTMPDVAFPDTMIAAKVSPDLIDRAFLQQVWNSNAVRRQIVSLARTTNGTFKINQTVLEDITFVNPPLALQQEFARRVAAIEKLKAAHRASLAELDALFASLQHRAFRGEL